MEADHDGVEIEDGLPIFSQDVKTDIAFQVNIRVVNLNFTSRINPTIASDPFRQ